jgi:RHS repeat-associated protein
VQRIYQKNRLSMEIQGAVHRRVMQFDDHVLAEQRATETVLPATDLQRSVLHSVDAQGQQGIAYSPYGHRPRGSDVFSLLGFAGERPDLVTGHYPLGKGYRSYNPVLMRFNQPDSLSPFGEGGVNAYAYCQGDPVNRSDPTGRFTTAFYPRVRTGFQAWRLTQREKYSQSPRSISLSRAKPDAARPRRPTTPARNPETGKLSQSYFRDKSNRELEEIALRRGPQELSNQMSDAAIDQLDLRLKRAEDFGDRLAYRQRVHELRLNSAGEVGRPFISRELNRIAKRSDQVGRGIESKQDQGARIVADLLKRLEVNIRDGHEV